MSAVRFMLLAGFATSAVAAPLAKEQLMVVPAGARHFTISSTAAKHGDVWSWSLPDGRVAYRMSMSLRGWITETGEVVTSGADGRTIASEVRGFTDSDDASEKFSVGKDGMATWATAVDSGSAPFGAKRYENYGGPWLAGENGIAALVAAGPRGLDMLLGGHSSISIGQSTQIKGPHGAETVKLAFTSGSGFAPSPVWLTSDNRFFASVGSISLMPEGYEAAAPGLKDIQEKATAAMVRATAHRFLAPANRRPTLFDHVKLFDSVGGRFLPDRAVLIADGKVAAVGKGGSLRVAAD